MVELSECIREKILIILDRNEDNELTANTIKRLANKNGLNQNESVNASEYRPVLNSLVEDGLISQIPRSSQYRYEITSEGKEVVEDVLPI